MKRILSLTAALAFAIWLVAQVTAPANRPIATLFPAGPALYLEAKNLQALMGDWNDSKEKQLWLASDNYNVFSRSNLFLKLQRAQEEFAAAAGVPPNMALLSNVAGAESALAIYDIGKLHFLYITRLPAAKLTDNSLWKARGKYEPRKSSGLDYYIRFDKASDRTAAFASANGYLLLATREDVLAGALSLIAQQNVPGMAAEPWYVRGVQAAKTPGELRLVLNIPALLQSPYMRSYWIQRNASELKQYSAAISDATRNAGEIREDRLLFRDSPETPAWNENAVAQITRLAPTNAGVYRAWASPTYGEAFTLIRDRILEPKAGPSADNRRAPDAGSIDATAGSEADLETRIDEAPLETTNSPVPDAFARAGKLDAMMYVASTRMLPDGVFVGIDSAVVLLGDVGGARTAIASTGIPVAVNGPVLVAGNRTDFVQAILANTAKPTPAPARYAAAYQHARELPNFVRLTRLIDNPLKEENPMFFSQNLASLGSSVLGRIDSASITIHDTGDTVVQTLVYKTKP